MLFKKKIPCYFLVYDQTKIIKRSLDFITQYSHRLDIIVIENKSPNTPKIRRIIENYGKRKLIKRYYLFDKNIMGKAFDTVITKELQQIRKSSFVMITDGDLVSNNKGWLDEELEIMKKNPNVFACGISLDMSNLPLKLYPNAKEEWIPPDKNEYEDFIEVNTGCHLLLFRGKQFAGFMDWKEKNNRYFIDGQMHYYCNKVKSMKWARTKKSLAYHLTWDLYNDPNSVYRKAKPTKIRRKTWYHNRKTEFILNKY